jgi:hypothetical protein
MNQQSNRVVQGGILLASVMAFEHHELIERFKRKLGLAEHEAHQLFADTKRYLYLCVVEGKLLAPPSVIDQGWHEFLMYTKDYQDFCLRYFGKFVHHTPRLMLQPHPVLRVSDTNALARAHFGELSSNWRVYSNDCSPDYDCNGDASCS